MITSICFYTENKLLLIRYEKLLKTSQNFSKLLKTSLVIGPMLIASSCLKDEVGKVSQINFTDVHALTITTSDSNDLRKNLRWISKGVAGLGHSFNTFKPQVHDFVLSTDYYEETNENIENLFGSSFLYANEHYTWLDLNIPTNDYDSSYFFDITLDGCEGKTCIRIPEADIVDTTKLHVVTPDEIFGDVESSTGYYFNTSTGLIDSLTITEDNMDSVYLWVVGVAFNCDEAALAKSLNRAITPYGQLRALAGRE
jgi:hypothetical protein